MPVTVRKKGAQFQIVEKATGRVVGHSDSRRQAEISASIRNRAHREKQKG